MRKCITNSLPIEISFEKFKEVSDDNSLLIDCRHLVDYETLHLDSSISLPLQQLSIRVPELDEYLHTSIFVYCRTGNRSGTFVRYLRSVGFTKCQAISGGIETWGREINQCYDIDS
ncbi:rhodanese-like domain-containing protein [PVC group bacterium]|nr:rhodanese-like domain-containing protein [PVC group bacterium]